MWKVLAGTSYVLSLFLPGGVFLHSCDHGLDFDIISVLLCENSMNQKLLIIQEGTIFLKLSRRPRTSVLL